MAKRLHNILFSPADNTNRKEPDFCEQKNTAKEFKKEKAVHKKVFFPVPAWQFFLLLLCLCIFLFSFSYYSAWWFGLYSTSIFMVVGGLGIIFSLCLIIRSVVVYKKEGKHHE